jgi:hypothetical protein
VPRIVQRVPIEDDGLQRRQMVEQRIAGRGRQDAVARIGKQLEQEGVGFAGAGREHDAARVNCFAGLPI